MINKINRIKKVLILGGGGALGRKITYLYKNDSHYECISAGLNKSNIVDCLVDITNFSQVEELLSSIEPDIVMNLTGTYSSDFNISISVNVQGSRNVLEVCKKLLNKKRTRVILMGSAAEYGYVTESECPIKEDKNLKPITINGMVKVWQSTMANYYYAAGVDVLIARIFNLYGPGISNNLFYGRVLSQIEMIKSGTREVLEIGNLNSIRDYISTEQAAVLIKKIANLGKSGEVYNIASGRGIKMREFLESCLYEHGLNMSIVFENNNFSNKTGLDIPIIY